MLPNKRLAGSWPVWTANQGYYLMCEYMWNPLGCTILPSAEVGNASLGVSLMWEVGDCAQAA